MEFIKQSVGIDIAKFSFTACLCSWRMDQTFELSEVRTFSNDKNGFNQLTKWIDRKRITTVPSRYVMEATGVYYESLAYHLTRIKKEVSVLLPNKVTYYAKSLNIKTKTDQDDARVIARMGCERQMRKWTAPSATFKELRSVCRLYKVLQDDKTQTNNRLKQIKCGHEPLQEAVNFHESTIRRLDEEMKKLEKMMEQILRSDDDIWNKVQHLKTIKGIGLKTIAIILGETQGFALIKNQRQLTSFCGYDVVRRESGTSIKGKTRISKKGNSNIRSAMYFPAMVASRYNPKMKKTYEGLLEKLMYTLWRTDQPYMENYHLGIKSGFHVEEVPSSSSTRRVEIKEKVVGVKGHPTTLNEHLYDQASEALLRQV